MPTSETLDQIIDHDVLGRAGIRPVHPFFSITSASATRTQNRGADCVTIL
jgi:hypothetical protein